MPGSPEFLRSRISAPVRFGFDELPRSKLRGIEDSAKGIGGRLAIPAQILLPRFCPAPPTVFQGKTNLTFIGQAFDWKPMRRGKPLNMKMKYLAEREGFEPPVRFPVHLISSQAPSTGLGHLSAFWESRLRSLRR